MKSLLISVLGATFLSGAAFAKNDIFQVVNAKHEHPVNYKVQNKVDGGYMHGVLNEGQASSLVNFGEPAQIGDFKTYRVIVQDAVTGQSLTGWGEMEKECSFVLRRVNDDRIILDNNTCAPDYLSLNYTFPEQKLTVTVHK